MKHRINFVLIFILLLGFILRFQGLDFGFPLRVHSDEEYITNTTYDAIIKKSFDTPVLNRPNYISLYLNSITYQVTSQIIYDKPITETFSEHHLTYLWLSRFIVALFGTLSILIMYLIGKEYSNYLGYLSAFVVAIFPTYIQQSHYATPDIPLLFFILFGIFLSIRYLKNPSNLILIVMVSIMAIGFAEKYFAFVLSVLIVTVVVIANYHNRVKLIFALSEIILVFAVAILVFSPNLYHHLDTLYSMFFIGYEKVHPGADGLDYLGTLVFYIKTYIGTVNIFFIFFFFIGFYYSIKEHKWASFPLLFSLIYWALISTMATHWIRWSLPMYITPIILSCFGILVLYKKYKYSREIRAGLLIIILIALIPLILNGVRVSAEFTLQDTRNVALNQLNDLGVNLSNSLYEGYSPFYPTGYGDLFDKEKNISKYEYVILSSEVYQRYFDEKNKYKRQIDFYNNISSYNLIKEYKPCISDRPEVSNIINDIQFFKKYLINELQCYQGPTIKVYKIN